MALDKVADVEIEADGVFKYILIELKEKKKKGGSGSGSPAATKIVVRGLEWADYHGTIITNCVCHVHCICKNHVACSFN